MGKRGGNRTPKPKQLQDAAALVKFKPQGKEGSNKRTPKTIAEQQELANEEFFEPEKILAEGTASIWRSRISIKCAGWATYPSTARGSHLLT